MYRIIIFAIITLMAACTPIKSKPQEHTPQKDIDSQLISSIRGDYDGNGVSDNEAKLYQRIMRDTLSETQHFIIVLDNNDTTALCSTAILSHLTHEGDLNGDGRDEIGIYRKNGSSSWGEYTILDYDTCWHERYSTTMNLQLLEQYGVSPNFDDIITIDSEHDNHVILRRYTILNGERVDSIEEHITIE